MRWLYDGVVKLDYVIICHDLRVRRQVQSALHSLPDQVFIAPQDMDPLLSRLQSENAV